MKLPAEASTAYCMITATIAPNATPVTSGSTLTYENAYAHSSPRITEDTSNVAPPRSAALVPLVIVPYQREPIRSSGRKTPPGKNVFLLIHITIIKKKPMTTPETKPPIRPWTQATDLCAAKRRSSGRATDS